MTEFISSRWQWSASGRVWVMNCLPAELDLMTGSRREEPEASNTVCLSGPDLERWRRYRPESKKRQFLRSREAVRIVLEYEFGVDHTLSWESLPSGRPVLRTAIGSEVANVSMSHSDDVFVIGLDSPKSRIGVDCEVIGNVSPSAVFRIVGQPSGEVADVEQRRWQAAMMWTQYEANWKAQQCLAAPGRGSCQVAPSKKLFLTTMNRKQSCSVTFVDDVDHTVLQQLNTCVCVVSDTLTVNLDSSQVTETFNGRA